MYKNFSDMLSMAEKEQIPLWKIILDNEMDFNDLSEEQVFNELENHFQVMEQSASKKLNASDESKAKLIHGISQKQFTYSQGKESLCGQELNLVMARALSCSEVNASMGKICAAPTAGACGILPAVLITMGEKLSLSRRRVLEGLLTASGTGAVIVKFATISGAEGGCQAECGVAAGMAAAAAVEMSGGSPKQALYAMSFALINSMGLVCDPVAGLVEIPCAQRNASQAINALLSADMALAGIPCLIPPDEVVEALYKVGKSLPESLRETSLGGIAVTKTARKIQKEL